MAPGRAWDGALRTIPYFVTKSITDCERQSHRDPGIPLDAGGQVRIRNDGQGRTHFTATGVSNYGPDG